MLLPITILAAIMGAITAPGLIAQYLEERRSGKQAGEQQDGHANA